MNAAVSFIVAVVAVLIVVGLAAGAVHHLLGQWAILGWIVIGWFAFLSVLKAARS